MICSQVAAARWLPPTPISRLSISGGRGLTLLICSQETAMSKLSQRQRPAAAESRPFEGLSQIHPHAAGVDIGAHEIMVCVPGPANTQLVRAFGSYTADLPTPPGWAGAAALCPPA